MKRIIISTVSLLLAMPVFSQDITGACRCQFEPGENISQKSGNCQCG